MRRYGGPFVRWHRVNHRGKIRLATTKNRGRAQPPVAVGPKKGAQDRAPVIHGGAGQKLEQCEGVLQSLARLLGTTEQVLMQMGALAALVVFLIYYFRHHPL